MISLTQASLCAALALAFYGLIGLPLAQRVLMRPLVPWLAPALGWAVHAALALPLCFVIGLDRTTAVAIFAVPAVIAAVVLWRRQPALLSEHALPWWLVIIVLAGVALIALDFMAVDLPKMSAQGVTLAAPIFDHSKIAMIDEMARLGVPPGNPFYGGEGPARLSYYYLWHFSAAELSLLTGLSGWATDAGMSAFTGFAAVLAMAGLAIWLSGRASAALWIVLLSFTASARPVLEFLLGQDRVEQIAGTQSGLGGFLFQTSWAPQHAMAALTTVLALIVLLALIERPRWPVTVLFGLMMVAGFESSTWVGGIVFPIMAAPVALTMLWRASRSERGHIVLHLVVAALIAVALISPFLYDQSHMAALRNDGPPVTIAPVQVLGDDVVARFGAFWNGLAYWLIYLPLEFPAIYVTGAVALFVLLRDRALPLAHRDVTLAFAFGALMSLVCAWLLVSTLGENNDLGWRAVLPAVLILMIASAAGLARLDVEMRPVLLAAALALIAVSLVDGLRFGYGNVVVRTNAATPGFADSEALWRAVRRVTPPGERVANNPDYMGKATPWPINISWALLADRRSCFAGRDFVRPFSALPQTRVDVLDALFKRVFKGMPEPGDIEQLANRYHCDTAVVAPSDGAWMRDPFAASALYQMVEDTPAWRIYRRAAP
ncbi:MAG: hypothetical protein JSR61_14275 [Proteobacteria bacterium]|nr:hypothetical protein [Pseudomonadota bacterium]